VTGLEGPEAALALGTLWVVETPERRAELARLAARVADWDGVLVALERHGVLGLAARNLPPDALPGNVRERLAERARALEEDALRFRFTLERFARALNARGVEPTLLKGASLTLDAYPHAALRGQGDLDLLVAPSEVEDALRAGEEAGLLLAPDSLPVWWYRHAHFHLKLAPGSALLREVEVHWALQHPSLLTTPGELAREPVDLAGARAFVLEPIDRLLHLVTHLVSHARGAPGRPDSSALSRVLAEGGHPLRLKWIADVRIELERLADTLDVARCAQRARAWGAAGQLAWVVTWVRSALALTPAAESLAERLVEALGADATCAAPAASRVREQRDRPLAALDFREDALALLPRWIWPPAEYLERRYGGAGLANRWRHALLVLARVLIGTSTLPVAFAQRALAK